MVKKTKDVKTYLSSIGKTEQLHVFVGYTDDQITNSSDDAAKNIWQNMLFSKRISRGDVVGVIPNVTWTYGNVYIPWKSGRDNTGAYYAWNRQNGNVYLCVENNIDCREDLSGKNASTYIPNHAYGIQAYPDGYSWLPIYRITSEYLRFVKNNWIPVISFEDFDIYTGATEYQNYSDFCGTTSMKTDGKCVLYAKDTLRIPASSTTNDTYNKGQFVTTFNTNCQTCASLFKDNPNYQAVFNTSGSIPSSITIPTKFEVIGNLVSQNRLPGSSAFYALYDIASNGLKDGAVVSVLINLQGFDTEDLVVYGDNPELTLTSYTGTDARIRFRTFRSISGESIISGIELLSNGQGYKDISLDISSSIFKNPAIKDLLLSAITVNYDILDGLNVDPYDVLNCKNIQIDTRIDITDILSNNILVPDTINMYSLVSNPVENVGGTPITSGSDLSPYTTKVSKGYVTLAVQYEGDTGPSKTRSPKVGSATARNTSGNTVYEPKILKLFNTAPSYIPPAVQSIITINNFDYSNISKGSKIVDSDNDAYDIKSIVEQPSLKQYSGKILQTVKTSKNLKMTTASGEITKVLRINMIKGV